MGYQAWFACPTDASGNGWIHWFSGTEPTVEMLPDVTELPESDRCSSPLTAADGNQVQLYSSASAAVIDMHFAWMSEYGLDGIALQRFANGLSQPQLLKTSDAVVENVRRSAEKHGRVFFVMYDLSGTESKDLSLIQRDWARLQRIGITRSRAYLRHRGHPLVGIWGLGFAGRPIEPADAKSLIEALNGESEVGAGVTVLAGVPAHWRVGGGDAASNPDWREVWPMVGVLSPWSVGRFENYEGIDTYRRTVLEPDMLEARRIGSDYMPVVFPGFSWSNLMRARHISVNAEINMIPRLCGRFYWRQVTDVLQAGAKMVYGAMFDEVDEGTAMYKVVPTATKVPGTGTIDGESFLTLDADGCSLPSDWYLRLAGAAASALRSGRAPTGELPFPIAVK